jgi:hypothetical protein
MGNLHSHWPKGLWLVLLMVRGAQNQEFALQLLAIVVISVPTMPPDSFRFEMDVRAGGLTQVVESLPSKCGTLSSNPGTAKRKH